MDSITDSMGNPPSVIEKGQYLPPSISIYENLRFKNVKNVGSGLMMITTNNEIIYHSMSNNFMNGQDDTLSSSLVIKGTQNDDVIIPTKVADVKYLILNGGEGSDVYQLKLEDWIKYKTIIIDNYSKDEKIDEIILPIKDSFDDLSFEKKDSDIIISDIANDALVTLRGVYGE